MMDDLSSVDAILKFLRRNNFTRAEAALLNELKSCNSNNVNGYLDRLTVDRKDPCTELEERNRGTKHAGNQGKSGDISKEMRHVIGRNESDRDKRTTDISVGQVSKPYEISETLEDIKLDLCSWKFTPPNGQIEHCQNDGNIYGDSFFEFKVPSNQKNCQAEFDSADVNAISGKALCVSNEKTTTWSESSSKPKNLLVGDKTKGYKCKDGFVVMDSLCSKKAEPADGTLDLRKDCSVKTVFPLPTMGVLNTNASHTSGREEVYKKSETVDAEKALSIGSSHDFFERNDMNNIGFLPAFQHQKEELPRLPPVRLKADEKAVTHTYEEQFNNVGYGSKITNADNGPIIGSYLNVPFGQEINLGGMKRGGGGSWLSVSHGITEDNSDLMSGFAAIRDGLSESIDYTNEYWDSDEYDDDDDIGYMRQPIEDEAWFLAHEIDYPSDNEKGTGHGSVPDAQESGPSKEDDNQSFADEDSYFSGEKYLKPENVGSAIVTGDSIVLQANDIYERTYENGLVPRFDDDCLENNHHDSVRSIGVGINSDGINEGFGRVSDHECDVGFDGSNWKYDNKRNDGKRPNRQKSGTLADGTFSFPSGKSLWSNNCSDINNEADDDLNSHVEVNNMLSQWMKKANDSSPVKSSRDENNASGLGADSSQLLMLCNYGYTEKELVKNVDDEKAMAAGEEDRGAFLEDDEAAVVQEQVRQIKAQEEEFETFNLRVVHRKDRTGFEEDKNFQVVLNSVIAGRYHVTEYLGSAAFSKAIQAHDLHTGMDVCIKIIKNNKDFFDQSLDEIKLLKFINKGDPSDKYHVLRLYDYFYYREHLLIVCELLKANLYEFQKFNRESGGEVYFTMPRLQSITIQCLEALQFLHGLGLIHCDLKPENILVKSYSRCEVKVIDLGSSCFETDHLCSYVQSRSYRAPEVILGLPYNKKIDIWSLGCILAELCTGNVLFQNDSPATLLARVIGIVGLIDQEMLAKGRDTHKYFTKSHMLYERNQEINRLEYLIPKKSSMRHRLSMADQGFIDFVVHLLEINPKKRPSASEALKHPWLSYPYEPISP
ncbi:probable serine/threonine-protein kinase clkA [Impatiens glandulifera]|uniref:probable serine/threonine-protein kinase clkA n=1 Tax=Impatiens glandulifera TaxID=253017 RepID=UPI001FB07713|nr:probable serine/threonine-protein kinase clkA [Impatiens glandulifera]